MKLIQKLLNLSKSNIFLINEQKRIEGQMSNLVDMNEMITYICITYQEKGYTMNILDNKLNTLTCRKLITKQQPYNVFCHVFISKGGGNHS